MEKEFENWRKLAQSDLSKAEILHKNDYFDGAAFFCQQAVEKGLKALLIKATAAFPKNHDLVRLAKLALAPESIVALCSRINPAYTASRYPDAAMEYTRADCEQLLAGSKVILKWIDEKLR